MKPRLRVAVIGIVSCEEEGIAYVNPTVQIDVGGLDVLEEQMDKLAAHLKLAVEEYLAENSDLSQVVPKPRRKKK